MSDKKEIKLWRVSNRSMILRENMRRHYSQPKGFVGRNLCYLVYCQNKCYGSIVAGSAVMHLKGRDEFFSMNGDKPQKIQQIVNNIFFHIEGPYPFRNFAQSVLALFRETVTRDWQKKYQVPVAGFESLVELPRTGEVYKRDGWREVGQTIGYTCKRTGGKGSDSWTGKRVWNTKDLRPKRVLCRQV